MKRFEVLDTDCEADSWIDNTDQIKGAFDYRIIEQILDEWDERIKFLEKENVGLKEQLIKEQLKRVKPPKFKHHQIVYAVANTDILRGQIEVYDFYEKKYLIHFYGIDDVNCLGDEWCYEHELFATKTKAQKHLEEQNEIHSEC